MKQTIVGVVALLWVTSAAWADPSCLEQAASKHYAGAVRTSFLNKCNRTACEASVKNLSGAAKTSTMTACVRKSCEARAAARNLHGAAADSAVKKCEKDTSGA